MKNIKLIFVTILLLSSSHLSHAQRGDDKNNVVVDTSNYYFGPEGALDSERGEILFQAYLKDPEKNEFIRKYNTYTYSLQSEKGDGNKIVTQPRKTIFYLPGGGFAFIDTDNSVSIDQCLNKDLATLLVEENPSDPYTVIILKEDDAYYTSSDPDLIRLIFNGKNNGISIGNPSYIAKFKIYKASLIAFHDTRRIIKDKVTNATTNNIDVNNMLMVGNSAGGILTLMYLFMDKNEIPTTFSLSDKCTSNWPTSAYGNVCSIPSNIKNDYWNTSGMPLPPMKGYMPMTSGLFMDYTTGLLSTNLMIPSTNKPKLYLMHGTCDELISENVEWLPYKYAESSSLISYTAGSVNATQDKLLKSYGSNWIYNNVNTKLPTLYDKVCGGGHKPHYKPKINISSTILDVKTGIWNACATTSNVINNEHRFYTFVSDFADKVFNNTFVTGIGTQLPEVFSQVCINDSPGVTPISDFTITEPSANNFNAVITGANYATQYEWKVTYCINNVGFTTNTYYTTVKNKSFSIPSSACYANVTVTAIGCNNVTATQIIPRPAFLVCNCSSTSSKLKLEEEILIEMQAQFLTIDFKEDGNLTLTLIGLNGTEISNVNTNVVAGRNQLNIQEIFQNNLISGNLYLLKVEADETLKTFKFIPKF